MLYNNIENSGIIKYNYYIYKIIKKTFLLQNTQIALHFYRKLELFGFLAPSYLVSLKSLTVQIFSTFLFSIFEKFEITINFSNILDRKVLKIHSGIIKYYYYI